jgi:hypothetical protein
VGPASVPSCPPRRHRSCGFLAPCVYNDYASLLTSYPRPSPDATLGSGGEVDPVAASADSIARESPRTEEKRGWKGRLVSHALLLHPPILFSLPLCHVLPCDWTGIRSPVRETLCKFVRSLLFVVAEGRDSIFLLSLCNSIFSSSVPVNMKHVAGTVGSSPCRY